MKIFPTYRIKELDTYTIEQEPIASIDLMERAAEALTDALVERWSDKDTPFVLFAGPGNNGGDALAVARLLAQRGYRQLQAVLFNPKGDLSADCQINVDRLIRVPEVRFQVVTRQFTPPELTSRHIVIDGLFGSGLNKPLSGGFATVVRYINASRATVVAIDIPSGLMGEDNSYNDSSCIIKAHLTLSLQLPKLAFLFAENEPYVGQWELLDIGLSEEGIDELPTDWQTQEWDDVAPLLRPRSRFAHKGTFGKALLIAGSQGMAGASILAAKAALHSGLGLLKVHVPFCNNLIVQTAVPEAITLIDFSDTCFSEWEESDGLQAVAVGPGLGQHKETEEALIDQINNTLCPMVVDADALNLLSAHRSLLGHLPKGSILTPHPGEMDRLVGGCQNSFERLQKAIQLAQTAQVHIVLKGAYTVLIAPDGRCWFNTTGNSGMATAGSGDVLTGILLALLAQGYDPLTAARLGVYVHGLAGDLAAKRVGEIGMTAGTLVEMLPAAWCMMQKMQSASC